MMIKILSKQLNLVKNNVNKLAINCQIRQYANAKEQLNQVEKELANHEEVSDLGHYDIVINGGGIVGLTFLLNLQNNAFLNGKRILLIEQQNKPKLKSNNLFKNQRVLSNRVSSFTESSRECFEKNGIWTEIDQYTKRINEMQIWSSNLNKAISFDSSDLGDRLQNICYIIENSVILNSLNHKLNHDQILYSTNVENIEEIDSQINLYTKSKVDQSASKLTCSLLIGCDGFNSLVRQKSNLDFFNIPLNQNGVVGTITMSSNEANLSNSISYQRFLPNKTVIAILPLTNEESSFVISTSKEFAKQLIEMNEQEFVDQFNHLLNCEIEHDLPNLIRNFDQFIFKILPAQLICSTKNRLLPKISAVQDKSRAQFPLGFGTTLPSLVGGIKNSSNINLAIIGDSAHRVHPLAGQGLNLGIGDAIVLSDCLKESLERGEELFESADCPLQKERLTNVLNEFERRRQLKLIAMTAAILGMQDLFHYTPPILLNVFDHMNWIKKQMIIYANSV